MIILVSAYSPPDYSGAGRRVFNFYSYLKENNIDCILITNSRNDKAFIVNRLENRKIGRLLDFFYIFLQLLKWGAKKDFSKINQKTVLLVGVSFLTNASAIYFRLFGFKVTTQVTLMGSDDFFSKPGKDRFGVKYFLKKIQYNLSHTITCVSPELYEISKSLKKKVSIIPNPVMNRFKIIGENKNSLIIDFDVLSVGEISFRKGHDLIFRIIDEIHRNHREFKFALVGPINKKDKDELMKLFNSLPNINTENVLFIGYKENIDEFYERSKLFLLPTRKEGFPNVFIEAMASGLPVVALKIPYTTDFIFTEEYNTILNEENAINFSEMILKLIYDFEFFERIKNIGLIRSREFQEEIIFNQYLKMLCK